MLEVKRILKNSTDYLCYTNIKITKREVILSAET